jgi:hypothetical protein
MTRQAFVLAFPFARSPVIARRGSEALVITHGFGGLEEAVPSDESHETKELSGKFHQRSLFDRNAEVKDNRTLFILPLTCLPQRTLADGSGCLTR